MTRVLRRALLIAAAWLVLRRPWLRWGATAEEVRRPLPGDHVVPHPMIEATRGITIAAPAATVWPWLAQMGHKRAGWYGLDWFDNEGVPSADHIVPELQQLAVGDVIPDAMGPFGFEVALLEPERAIAYRATIHPITGKPVRLDGGDRRPYIAFSWSFILDERDDRTTRLLTRVRYTYPPSRWIGAVVHLFELTDTIFTLQTLPGIKRRAESMRFPPHVGSGQRSGAAPVSASHVMSG